MVTPAMRSKTVVKVSAAHLFSFSSINLRQLDHADPDRLGALQEPPDLLDPQILTPDQPCDLQGSPRDREARHGRLNQ
ncbi:hypothetical protein EYF80_058069 [Liparis tanakae]|uniref:Uncharacterized protein n=1 Tax=Liparis tanakae TaxID=230148 RepID=A0A4Z2ESL2_9TELE|nr:hypothetical protein EYF80_058069 [Liparis tanakae]